MFKNHFEEPLSLLVPFEVLSVGETAFLPVGTLEIRTVTFDVVEHVLVPVQKLGGISLEQVGEPGYLGAAGEDGMPAEEPACVVERPQLGKSLIVANPQLCHICYLLRGRDLIKHFVELLHLPPSVDAVVVDDGCHLHVGIIEVGPVYFRVLFFFGDRLFFSVAGFGFAVFRA